jgi:hypothetical protein
MRDPRPGSYALVPLRWIFFFCLHEYCLSGNVATVIYLCDSRDEHVLC